ncbi:hypothetical protein MTQ00_21940 [Chryseobacterium sp. B21-037]|uniref:hypothetical protein n=1 Tax=Chryseobacterium sp. B21-037 TaxID=2926038 RepID=UPI00235A374D|nr:hypothetical protein [Chryseobacterium sp. B21-037]MDC8107151.1 hypothetical protein [Chryseobacterium sp. B21-037]WBV56346.1 hypothetical protein PFY10_19345 [Chryseobacterium daecheongense]
MKSLKKLHSKDFTWPVLKALNDLYEKKKTTAKIQQVDYIRYLMAQTELIAQKKAIAIFWLQGMVIMNITKPIFNLLINSEGREVISFFAFKGWWANDLESFNLQTPSRKFIEIIEDAELFAISKMTLNRCL